MSVDVVIPAHNEGSRIAAVLEAVRGSSAIARVIVVADACTDSTVEVAYRYASNVVAIDAKDKGTAMANGLTLVTASHVLFLDADLQGLKPAHVDALALLEPLEGQLVGIRGNIPARALASNLPSLSGERRLPVEVARQAHLYGSGWQAETRLNATVARLGLPWRHIVLEGVTNPTKAVRAPLAWGWEVAQVGWSALAYGPELARYATHPG